MKSKLQVGLLLFVIAVALSAFPEKAGAVTPADPDYICQAQKDVVAWVNNLVDINWGNTESTYNYDGSSWVVCSYQALKALE